MFGELIFIVVTIRTERVAMTLFTGVTLRYTQTTEAGLGTLTRII